MQPANEKSSLLSPGHKERSPSIEASISIHDSDFKSAQQSYHESSGKIQNVENELDDLSLEQEKPCHQTRYIFGSGMILGGIGVGVSQDPDVDQLHFAMAYAVIWAIITLLSFCYNWNFAVLRSHAKASEKFFDKYNHLKRDIKALQKKHENFLHENQVTLVSRNTLILSSYTLWFNLVKILLDNSVELTQQQKKISVLGSIIEDCDININMEAAKILNDQTLSQAIKQIEQRQALCIEQEKIRNQVEIAEIEYQRDDVLNRARVYFEDADGEDRVIDETEFPKIQKHFHKISHFEHMKGTFGFFQRWLNGLKFKTFTDGKAKKDALQKKFDSIIKKLNSKINGESSGFWGLW
eukprot:jgi/Bigna1/84313/fgenesh1_pg.129_\